MIRSSPMPERGSRPRWRLWDPAIPSRTWTSGRRRTTSPSLAAWGPIEKGHQSLMETFRWVGSRFKTGALVPEDSVFFASGDLAYTVGFERGEVAVDDGSTRPMT